MSNANSPSDNLFEALHKKGRVGGYCHHPLLKRSQYCSLCWVWNEGEKKLERACQVEIKEGDRYTENHEEVRGAVKEAEDILKRFKENHFQEDKTHDYSYAVTVNFKDCTRCLLCLDFEESIEAKSIELSGSGDLTLREKADHNYGVNLIPLCPSQCFNEKDVSPVSGDKVVPSFCRGCDRMCETEVHLHRRGQNFEEVFQRAPMHSAYWVCDEVNESFKGKNLGIPLRSALEKKGEEWTMGLLPKLDGDFHFILPENLPGEIITSLSELFQKGQKYNLTYQIFSWKERQHVTGLLRPSYFFEQPEYLEFQEKFSEKNWEEGIDKSKKIYLIAPEWIVDAGAFTQLLKRAGKQTLYYAGSFYQGEILRFANYLIPLPSYKLLSWNALNYHKEVKRVSAPEERVINLVREEER